MTNVYAPTTVPPGLTNVVAVAAGGGVNLVLQGRGVPRLNLPLVARSLVAEVEQQTYLRVEAVGTPPFSYQWRLYGTNIEGATNSGLWLSQAGPYSVAVSNALGQTISGEVPVSVVPLRISLSVSDSVFAGSSESFFVAVTGVGPFTYQWRFNGTNLAAATNSWLLIQAVSFDQAGTYSVAVSNALGQVISGEVPVSVVPLRISSQPSSNSIFRGGSVNFSVAATGVGPFTYQWWFNGPKLPGATNATLVISNAQFSQAGNYAVTLANQYGSAQSLNAWLEVENVWEWGQNYYGQTNVSTGLSNVVAVAAGGFHNLVLKGDGTVVAWGENNSGQTNVPSGLTNVVAVAAGWSHSLALKCDGTVVAWGGNGTKEENVPPDLSNVVAVAAGVAYSLALKGDGTVVAWGQNHYGQTNVPSGLNNVVAVAAGGSYSLALKSDGTLVAWGDNSSGQTTIPSGLTDVVAVTAGGRHSLALKSDGTVIAWGDNSYGQTNVPSGLTNVIAVVAGGDHSLVLKDDGTVVAWGENYYGQTNVPLGLSNVVAVAVGSLHNLVLIGGSPLQGRLGNPSVSGGQFHLTIAGLAGTQYQYTLEQSTDLQHWTSVQTNSLPGGGRQWVVPAGTNHQFFRVSTTKAHNP